MTNSRLVQWPRAKYWDKAWNPIIGCKPCSPACEHDGLWDAKVEFAQGIADIDPFNTVTEIVPPRLVIETETKGEAK